MANSGTEYADTITDVQGGNTIYAGGGNDLIIARDEYIEEIIDGGEGMDTVSFINLERVNVNIGPVTMSYGYASQTGDLLFSIENVIGSNGGDGIKGNTGANELYGLAGGDVLEGGLGADLLSGGTGTDYAVYENSGARVAVDLSSGQGVGGEAEGDRLVQHRERLRLSLRRPAARQRGNERAPGQRRARLALRLRRQRLAVRRQRQRTCWTAAAAPTSSPAAPEPTSSASPRPATAMR